MRANLILIVLIVSLSSCQNDKQTDTVSAKLDSIISENRKLSEKISLLEREKSSKRNEEPSSLPYVPNRTLASENQSNDESIGGRKYAFVLLSIVKKEFNADKWRRDLDMERNSGITIPDKGNEYNNYYVASKIQSFNSLSEDAKYRFIDEVQNSLKYSSVSFNMESIKKRQCLVFDSYKEASIARARYITDENEGSSN